MKKPLMYLKVFVYSCIQEAANGHANGSSEKHQSNGGNMVKTFQAYLPPSNRTYSCVHCRAHLASHDELISKVSRFFELFVYNS